MDKSPIDVIKNAAKLGAEAYQNLFLNDEFEYFQIQNINCVAMPTAEEGYLKIENFWDKLHFKDKNGWKINEKCCLYYFEIDDPKEETNRIALDTFLNFRNAPDCRNCSAVKNDTSPQTKVLYVGKVKKNIGKRMVVHFGYANPKTGGLQLMHWAKLIGLNLHLHIFVFDEKMQEFVEPLEYLLANSLRPLIGKH